MGWKPPERYRDTYRLVFADPEYHGLEVVVRRVSFGAFRSQLKLTTLDRDKLVSGQLDQADLDKLTASIDALGHSLVSWNLEDHEGSSVPCTPEALDQQDLTFGLELMDAWWVAAQQHQVPQPRPEPVELGDLPVDVLSQ